LDRRGCESATARVQKVAAAYLRAASTQALTHFLSSVRSFASR
jgi:hypothetical protein